jgi:adenosine deaminase
VWQALEILWAVRIGHALSIEDDPKSQNYILEHRIGIEANLTSNLQTTSVPDLISHPLKSWLERGLLATINTDDPGISGIDLIHEFGVAAPAAGLSEKLIYKAQKNSLEISFLAQSEKELLLSKYQ